MEKVKSVLYWVGLMTRPPAPDEPKQPQNMQEVLDNLPPSFTAYMKKELPFRRWSALSFLLICLCLGLPLWSSTTQTYRAPFPIFPANQTVPLNIKVILAVSDASLLPQLNQLATDLRPLLTEGDVVAPLTIKWIVETAGKRSLSDLTSDRGSSEALEVRVALVPSAEWPHFSATHVHLGRGKWALVQWNGEQEATKTLSRLHDLIWEVMVDVPHLSAIVRRDLRQRMQPWQIASLPLSNQKRLVWDSAPLSMHYLVHIVHLHDNASPRSNMPPTSTAQLIRKIGTRLQNITTLEVSTEHLWDINISAFLEKDVQDRWTLTHSNMERLIKEIEDQSHTVDSAHPLLRIAILETEIPVVLLDQYEEDSTGSAVAAWGAIIPRCASTDARAAAAMRVLLGVDAELPPGWQREAVPLADWETDRMRLRALLDNSMRAISAIGTLQALTEKITTIVVEDEVAERATDAVRYVTEGLERVEGPSLEKIASGRRLADEALSHPSLLSLLYFPQDQKVAVYMPIALPTLLPLFGSVLTLSRWLYSLLPPIWPSKKKTKTQ